MRNNKIIRKMKKIIVSIYILALILNYSNSYSQKSKQAESGHSVSYMTEYKYYENLRLERKEKKVKTIKQFDYSNDALNLIDYFDAEGYLKKREIYYTKYETGESILVTQIDINQYNNIGGISGTYKTSSALEGDDNYEFNNLSLKRFYDTDAFYGEGQIDSVNYVFDNADRLIEKRSYNDNLYGTGKEYESEFLYYDKVNKLINSKSTTGENSVSYTKYYYNEKSLLMIQESSYDFQNWEKTYGIRFEYEFYQ